jgi:uncharacterized protein
MLIRFELSNFRSIDEPVELSLVAVDRDRVEARFAPLLSESIVPVAAIYGPNASGKSNIVAGLAWLRDAIRSSLRFWEDGIPIEPFAFSTGPDRPTTFVLEALISNVRFEYILELDQTTVSFEALYHYPEKRRRRIFEREKNDVRFQRGFSGATGTRELLTDRTLVLSAARRFDDPLVARFADTILQMQVQGLRRRRSSSGYRQNLNSAVAANRFWSEVYSAEDEATLFDDTESGDREIDVRRLLAFDLLRLADLGIDDVAVDEVEEIVHEAGGGSRVWARKRVRLVHRTATERKPFEMQDESEGTQTWFRLIGPVLDALSRGTALLFDELDSSLHPTLSAKLIELFHNPMTNPNCAQIIFTSHDTSLLNYLNRDEVWLTEKNESGSTRLGALTDFAGERVRRSQNIERGYLRGRFGALPDLDDTQLLRDIGLIG